MKECNPAGAAGGGGGVDTAEACTLSELSPDFHAEARAITLCDSGHRFCSAFPF